MTFKKHVILRSEASSGSYQKNTPSKNAVQILNKHNYPLTLPLSPGEGTDANSSPAGEENSRMSNSELRMQVRVGKTKTT